MCSNRIRHSVSSGPGFSTGPTVALPRPPRRSVDDGGRVSWCCVWGSSGTCLQQRQERDNVIINNLYNSPTQTWSWVHGFIYFGEEPSSGVRAQTCRRDSGSLLSDLYLTCFTLEVLIEDLSLQVKPRRLSLELDVIPVLDLSRLCTWLCDFLVLWLDSGLTCSLESCDWFLDLS